MTLPHPTAQPGTARTVNRMRPLAHDSRHRRVRRGAEFLEAALIFPFMLFFLIATVDVASALLQYSALQDVAYAAARSAAAAGGADVSGSNLTETVLRNDVSHTPGLANKTVAAGESSSASTVGYIIKSGAVCSDSGANNHVTLTLSTKATTITPYLGSVLSLISGNGDSGSGDEWTINATAIARCEVIRQ